MSIRCVRVLGSTEPVELVELVVDTLLEVLDEYPCSCSSSLAT